FSRSRRIIRLQTAEAPRDAAAARDRAVAIKDDRVLKRRFTVAEEFAGVRSVHVYRTACSRIDNAARVDKFDAGCRNVRVELKDSINECGCLLIRQWPKRPRIDAIQNTARCVHGLRVERAASDFAVWPAHGLSINHQQRPASISPRSNKCHSDSYRHQGENPSAVQTRFNHRTAPPLPEKTIVPLSPPCAMLM